MNTSLHDNLLAELQRGGVSQEADAATQDGSAPLDLEYVEKLASDVEGLLEEGADVGEPTEESPVDVHAIIQNRLEQVKTASTKEPEDVEQARQDLLNKLAQVVPGVSVESEEDDTSGQAKAVLADWLSQSGEVEKTASGATRRSVADLVGGTQ